MDDIIIKKATAEDLKAVQTLNNKLFKHEYDGWDKDLQLGWSFGKEGQEYFSNILNNEIAYIAFSNGNPVGYLAGNTKAEYSYYPMKIAEIDNMFVEDSYRGKDVGSMLIDKFKEYCKEKGITTFKVNASSPNSKAIQFYQKNGFKEHDVNLWCKI